MHWRRVPHRSLTRALGCIMALLACSPAVLPNPGQASNPNPTAEPSAKADPAPGASTNADADKTALAVEALSRLPDVDLEQNSKLKETVLRLLERTRGTPGFVKLVQKFHIPNQGAS